MSSWPWECIRPNDFNRRIFEKPREYVARSVLHSAEYWSVGLHTGENTESEASEAAFFFLLVLARIGCYSSELASINDNVKLQLLAIRGHIRILFNWPG